MDKEVNTPRQIVDRIKKDTNPKIWSKDLRNWYVAEIIDLVRYNVAQQKKEMIEMIGEAFDDWYCDSYFREDILEKERIGMKDGFKKDFLDKLLNQLK